MLFTDSEITLFKSDSVSDTETVVTEALKRSFMERIKKEIV